MSKKQQPLPFSKQNYSSTVHINPLRIIQKAGPRPHQNSKPEPKVETVVDQKPKNEHQLPRTKQIVKTKEEKLGSYRTKMCPHGRDCKNRARCRFAHTAQQLRRPFYKRTKPCLLYQRGLCSLGSACRQYHGNFELKNFDEKKYKIQPCGQFEKGSCPLGIICTKAHGNEELEYYRAESAKMQLQSKNHKTEDQKPVESQKILLKLVGYEGRKRDYKLQFVAQEEPAQIEPRQQDQSEQASLPQDEVQPQQAQADEEGQPQDFSFVIPAADNSNK